MENLLRTRKPATCALAGPDAGYGGTQPLLSIQGSGFIFVALPWPEKALEAIFGMTRDEVKMYMWHALTDVIVHGDKGAIGLQTLFYGSFQQLGILKEWPDKRGGQIGERFVMVPGH
jgi:hypothetical protein